MATRSTIAIERADGTVHQVYCHWDGYISNNGRLLLEHYSDPAVLQELIDLGSISTLGYTVGVEHPFNHHSTKMTLDEHTEAYRDMTTFYARDRGEELSINKFDNYENYRKDLQVEEFNYILRNTGLWEFTVSDVGVVCSLSEAWDNEQLMYP
jgi:hypothetical protein